MFQSFENGISTFLSFHKMLCNCLRSCGPCDPSLGSPQHRYDISCKPQFRQFFPFFFFFFFLFFLDLIHFVLSSLRLYCLLALLLLFLVFSYFLSIPFYLLLAFVSFYCLLFSSILLTGFALLVCYLLICFSYYYSYFFFCQLYPGPRNCKSVFLILKILQYDG